MIINPNINHVHKITEAINKNKGYCPCVIDRNEDTICPCVDMMKNNNCHCKLFIDN